MPLPGRADVGCVQQEAEPSHPPLLGCGDGKLLSTKPSSGIGFCPHVMGAMLRSTSNPLEAACCHERPLGWMQVGTERWKAVRRQPSPR